MLEGTVSLKLQKSYRKSALAEHSQDLALVEV